MKTVMQELKEKIQNAIGEYNGVLNDYESGWKQCLITIQNHIEDEFLEKEKEQLKEMYLKGIENYDPTFKRKSQWTEVDNMTKRLK